jgi:WD40 repeat protein
LCGSHDNKLNLWESDIEKPCFECKKSFNQPTENICILNTYGSYLIVGLTNGSIKIWNIETTKLIETISEAHSKRISVIHIISNGKFLTGSFDKLIKLWDLNTFECICTYKGHSCEIRSIEKISKNKFLSGSDKDICLWDINSDKYLKIFKDVPSSWSLKVITSDKFVNANG